MLGLRARHADVYARSVTAMLSKHESGRWLLVTVSTAGAAASLRVHAWRRLRGLGALYLQQSVCLLPVTETTEREIARLVSKVRRGGGQARCLHVQTSDETETAALIAQVQAAADEEYADFLERLPEFFAELATETARGRATFTEVEESEADLSRYQTWAAKIQARDYFKAPLGDRVRAELLDAAEALAQFEALALAQDAPDNSRPTTRRIDADDAPTPDKGTSSLRAVRS